MLQMVQSFLKRRKTNKAQQESRKRQLQLHKRFNALDELEQRLVPSTVWPSSGTFHGPWDLASSVPAISSSPSMFAGKPPPPGGGITQYYWVGDAGHTSKDWSAISSGTNSYWSLTSGGALQPHIPIGGDGAIFDANSKSDCVIGSSPGTAVDTIGSTIGSNFAYSLHLNISAYGSKHTQLTWGSGNLYTNATGQAWNFAAMAWNDGYLGGPGEIDLWDNTINSTFSPVTTNTFAQLDTNMVVEAGHIVNYTGAGSGANIKFTNGHQLYVEGYMTLAQSTNVTNSGGFLSDGNTSNTLYAGDATVYSGIINREITGRTVGDHPDANKLVCNVPIVVYGHLGVDDGLKLGVYGQSSIGYSVRNEGGTIYLFGNAELYELYNFVQRGSSLAGPTDVYTWGGTYSGSKTAAMTFGPSATADFQTGSIFIGSPAGLYHTPGFTLTIQAATTTIENTATVELSVDNLHNVSGNSDFLNVNALQVTQVGSNKPTFAFDMANGTDPGAAWNAYPIEYTSVAFSGNGITDHTETFNPGAGGWIGGYTGEHIVNPWGAASTDIKH